MSAVVIALPLTVLLKKIPFLNEIECSKRESLFIDNWRDTFVEEKAKIEAFLE